VNSGSIFCQREKQAGDVNPPTDTCSEINIIRIFHGSQSRGNRCTYGYRIPQMIFSQDQMMFSQLQNRR